MNDTSYGIIVHFAEHSDLSQFTDRVDNSKVESLCEYGFVRNPETNDVRYVKMNYDLQAGTESVSFQTTTVTLTEVIEAIEAADDTFFDFIGSSRESELMQLNEARIVANEQQILPELASIIHSLQAHHAPFWQPSN